MTQGAARRNDPDSLARRAGSLRRAGELAGAEQPFALVTVIRTEPATSARVGDKAVVHADGTIEGWVGGGCIGPTARREALAALEDGEPRLIRITPDTADSQPGVRMARMTCASEGTADLYVEPFRPRPTLILAGDSPVAETLAAVAPPLGFRVVRSHASASLTTEVVPFPQDSWMVVASFGEYDEEAVETGVRFGLPYIGLIASERRAARVLSDLQERGLSVEELSVVRSPAGLPLGAGIQEAIPLSILAEILSLRAARRPERKESSPPTESFDPVCGMTVEEGKTSHAAEYAGERFLFCCAGCKRAFEREPEKYAVSTARSRA